MRYSFLWQLLLGKWFLSLYVFRNALDFICPRPNTIAPIGVAPCLDMWRQAALILGLYCSYGDISNADKHPNLETTSIRWPKRQNFHVNSPNVHTGEIMLTSVCLNVRMYSRKVSSSVTDHPRPKFLWHYFGHDISIHAVNTGHIRAFLKPCCKVDVGHDSWKYHIYRKKGFSFEHIPHGTD